MVARGSLKAKPAGVNRRCPNTALGLRCADNRLLQRWRKALIIKLHRVGVWLAVLGMVALFRAIQVIVRPRPAHKHGPFSIVAKSPLETNLEGFNPHDMARALFALRVYVGTGFDLIKFLLAFFRFWLYPSNRITRF